MVRILQVCNREGYLYNESEWLGDFWNLCELVMLIISCALNAKNKIKKQNKTMEGKTVFLSFEDTSMKEMGQCDGSAGKGNTSYQA